MPDTATTVLGVDLAGGDQPQAGAAQDSFLDKYVGEGKKYKSVDELAKAYANAETFIETLKSEKQTLEQEMSTKLAGAKTVEDIMAVLTTAPDNVPDKDHQSPTVTADQIARMVEETLSKRQQLELVKANQAKAWSALAEKLGSVDGAKKAIADYIGGDKQKQDLVNHLGSYVPEDLVDLIAMRNKKQTVNFTDTGEVNQNFTDVPIGTLSWEQVRKIKRENPALYKSRQFQLKLHKLSAEGKLN